MNTGNFFISLTALGTIALIIFLAVDFLPAV